MKRFICLLLPLLLFWSSCDRYLDIKPNGRTIPNTADEFASLLHSRLNRLDYGSDEPLLRTAADMLTLECYSENLDGSLTDLTAGRTLPIYAGSDINKQSSRYANLYSVIKDCNIIIGNMQGNDEYSGKVLGTAYAMRGVAYYNLLREFCEAPGEADQLGLPLVKEFDMEAKPSRSTYRETVSFIAGDLEKALEYKMNDSIFRFTEDVVQAYLARLHFWTESWDKAIPYAENLLNKYPMLSDSSYVKMIKSRNGQTGNMILRSYIFNDQSADIIYNSSMQEIKARPVSKGFADLFPKAEKDIRDTLSFNKKRESVKNLISCIRTDEMCLILAEAYAHKQDDNRALYYLNMIRGKRIKDYVPYTMSTLPEVNFRATIIKDATGKQLTPLMQAILNERRKELFGEGDRFYELKRNGSPEFWVASNGFKYVMYSFLYTYPFPRIDVDITAGLVQNPGYDNLK